MRRRRQFAAPFVIVAGCWGDRGATTPVIASPPPAADGGVVTATAPVDARQVAITADAAPGACDLDPTASGCNPPSPQPIVLTFNAIVVTYIGRTNGGIEFEVEVPGNELQKRNPKALRGTFRDDKSQPILGSDFQVISRTRNRARCHWKTAATSLPSQRVILVGDIYGE